MSRKSLYRKWAIGPVVLLAGIFAIAGCQRAAHPDEKDAVEKALNSNGLGEVHVSQDRDKGVMTLKGDVASADVKDRAESVARQAAPDYTMADEVGVRPPNSNEAGSVASNLDSAIEDNFKAAIKAHGNLNDQSIRGSAKNGTLVINGTVKTEEQKKEAESLARKVPNVQQVVNELEVKPNKHSSSNS